MNVLVNLTFGPEAVELAKEKQRPSDKNLEATLFRLFRSQQINADTDTVYPNLSAPSLTVVEGEAKAVAA